MYQLLETTHALHIQIGQLARVEPGPRGQHTAFFRTLVRLRRIYILNTATSAPSLNGSMKLISAPWSITVS